MKKIIGTLSIFISAHCLANPDVTSREYKLILKASNFNYSNESSTTLNFINEAKSAIEQAIDRDVSGNPQLAKIRDISFYDTKGSCLLNSIGYSFRERTENNNSEVTLKFRSADRYISDFEDLSASSNQAETKLESDIGANSTNDFKVVYGHSTKAPNTRNINKMDDINDQFPGFESDYDFSNSIPLDVVGNLAIREHVYKGVVIDLGQFDAEISVTLWYNNIPSGTQSPIVAEVSFKYEDNPADYSKKVVNRARQAFNELKTLTSWTDPNSKTKTRFVYEFDANFCN